MINNNWNFKSSIIENNIILSKIDKLFLTALLNENPDLRLTADEALDHEWFNPKFVNSRIDINSLSDESHLSYQENHQNLK